MRPTQVRFVVVAGILTCSVPAALASPAMIRLGYLTCSGCHLSPQGRGLLTDYGKGIDEAESARAGDGELTHERRRVMHDVRLLAQIATDPIANRGAGSTSTTGGEWLPLARLWYRNATFLGERQRVSAIVSVDQPARGMGGSIIEPASDLPRVFLSRAMWEIRFRPGLELAVGRDVLPRSRRIVSHLSVGLSRH